MYFNHLKTVEHLLGPLVPSLLLLILVSSLTILILGTKEREYQHLMFPRNSYRNQKHRLINLIIKKYSWKLIFALYLFFIALVLLVFALLTDQVQLRYQLCEVDAALLWRKIHLRHV